MKALLAWLLLTLKLSLKAQRLMRSAQPMAEFWRFMVAGKMIFTPIVHHPGTKPNPFMQNALEQAQSKVDADFCRVVARVGGRLNMTKFYDSYKAVFDAIKTALVYVPAVPEVPAVPAHDEIPEVPASSRSACSWCSRIKTVIVGEQFTLDLLPKATINPIPGPIDVCK